MVRTKSSCARRWLCQPLQQNIANNTALKTKIREILVFLCECGIIVLSACDHITAPACRHSLAVTLRLKQDQVMIIIHKRQLQSKHYYIQHQKSHQGETLLAHRLTLFISALTCIISAQEVGPEARVETPLPKLFSQLFKEQKVPQEDGDLGHSPSILRIDLLTLSTQKPQIIPDEVTLFTPNTQLKLLLKYLSKTIKVVSLMRVVVVLTDTFFDLGKHPHCLAVRYEVSLSRSDLFIPRLEVLAAVDAGDRAKVDQSSSMVSIDHDIDLLQIPMDDLFLIEKKKSEDHVLHDLHLPVLSQPALSEVERIVLQVDLAIGKWAQFVAIIAVILGEVGTHLVPHIFQKTALILQWYIVALLHLQGHLLNQTAVLHHRLIVYYHYLRPSTYIVNTHLEYVTVDAVEDLCISACTNHALPSFLLNDD